MLTKIIINSIKEGLISKVCKNNIFSSVFTANPSHRNFSELGMEITEHNKHNVKVTTNASESNILFKKSKSENPNLINDTNLGLTYAKIDKNLLSELLLTARNRKYRTKNSEIVIEGRRLIKEAISCGLELKKIIFSQKDELSLIKEQLLKLPKFEIYKIPHHYLQLWSTVTTQPGLLAIFNRPNTPIKEVKNVHYVPITVLLDNIREPKNVGSIIRICAALPCNKIIMLKGCCDPWEAKALRSGCGGHFRINIETNCKWDDLTARLPEDASVYIADCNIEKMRKRYVNVKEYSEVKMSKNNFLIIGGEAHGVSEEAYNLINNRKGIGIHISLANNVESLNTASALALILFTLRGNLLH